MGIRIDSIARTDSLAPIDAQVPSQPHKSERHPPATEGDRHPGTQNGDRHAAPHEGHPATPEELASEAEPVELSSEAERLRSQRAILQAVFDAVEQAIDPDADALFEAAGRSAHLGSIERSNALSPEATAKGILDGITGYIYAAFRLAHPDATAKNFEHFAVRALRGFEEAFGKARKIIEGVVALTPGLAPGIDRTEELVHEGLHAFFVDGRKRFAALADR